MARIPAEDTSDTDTTSDTETTEERPPPTERMEDIDTAPEDDTDPIADDPSGSTGGGFAPPEEDAPEPTPEPEQPTRGGGPTTPEPEPDPEPAPPETPETQPAETSPSQTLTPGDLADGESFATEQGLETGTGRVAEQASQFEQQLAREQGVEPENVAIQRRDGQLIAQLTRRGAAERFAAELADRPEIAPEDVQVEGTEITVGPFESSESRTERMDRVAGQLNRQRSRDLETAYDEANVGLAFSEQLDEQIARANRQRQGQREGAATAGDDTATLTSGFGLRPVDTEVQTEVGPSEAETIAEATAGGGFLSEQQEGQVREATQEATQELTFEEEIEQATSPAGATISGFLGGLGRIPGGVAGGIGTGISLGESTVETGQSVVAGDVTAGEVQRAAEGATAETGEAAIEEIQSDPASAVGEIVGGAVIGSAAVRGLESASDIASGARLRVRADQPTVELEDITTERGAQGELPEFDTDPDAPTQEAVEEVSERARQQPGEITPEEGEGVLFHTTEGDLPGDLTVTEGRSELPGLFTSPEASPIGLPGVGNRTTLSDISLRRPQIRSEQGQVVAIPGEDVRGMPPGATGAGYELRTPGGDVETRGLGRGEAKARAEGTELEVRPQSDTPGYQFLAEEAEPGAAYVRPSGARTTELEAITPPGSEFVEEGVTPVRVSGRTIPRTDITIPGTGRYVPGRRFRRADVDAGDAGTPDIDRPAEEGAVTAYELPSSRVSRREGIPVSPPFVGPTPTRTATDAPSERGATVPASEPSDMSLFNTAFASGIGGFETGISPTASEPLSATTGLSSFGGSPTGGSGGPTGAPTGTSGSPTGTSPGPSGTPTGAPGFGGPGGTPTAPADFDLPDFDADETGADSTVAVDRGETVYEFLDPLLGE